MCPIFSQIMPCLATLCDTFAFKLANFLKKNEKTNKVFTYTLRICKEFHLHGTYFDGDSDTCMC